MCQNRSNAADANPDRDATNLANWVQNIPPRVTFAAKKWRRQSVYISTDTTTCVRKMPLENKHGIFDSSEDATATTKEEPNTSTNHKVNSSTVEDIVKDTDTSQPSTNRVPTTPQNRQHNHYQLGNKQIKPLTPNSCSLESTLFL